MAIAFLIGMVFNIWHSNVTREASLFMVVISATTTLLSIALVIQLESDTWRNWIYTLISLQMLFGPFLYLYTRYQCDPNFRWQRHHWLHFAPALIFAVLWTTQLPLSPSHWLYVDCHHPSCIELLKHRFWHKVAAWISIISYCVMALGYMRPHEQNIKARFSTLEGIQVSWLKGMAWGLLSITFLGIGADITREVGLVHNIRGGDFQALGPFITIFLFAKYGIYQKNVYVNETSENGSASNDNSKLATIAPEIETKPKKYQTSSLTSQDAAEIWQQLQVVMSKEHPFLKAGLKISELALQLGVSVNHLSETINGYANLSFYDYINKLRIEEAERLLTDANSQHLSVTDIGYQAGFNSSSTFYSHFKKLTSQTPRQFREQLLHVAEHAID